jgi:hypothetical protein
VVLYVVENDRDFPYFLRPDDLSARKRRERQLSLSMAVPPNSKLQERSWDFIVVRNREAKLGLLPQAWTSHVTVV